MAEALLRENRAVSNLEGSVQLPHSDEQDPFRALWFLIPSRLEGMWGTVDEKAGRLADARHIFKCIKINWPSITVTGISGTMITMPDIAYVSIFMDNDLTHITEDHFEIKLIARLLDQIYVIQPPMFPPKYDDAPLQEYDYSQPHTSTDGTRPSAPQFPEHLHLLLTCS